jgi:hypothetical protein
MIAFGWASQKNDPLEGDPMDHKDQHHEQHRKEREEHKKEQKQYEGYEEKQIRTIHPAWFVAIGIVLIAAVVLVWTFAW